MASTPEQTQSPRRRGRAAAVAEDAPAQAAAAFARMGFADPRLVLHWREIAGPDIARLARPLRLGQGPAGGTLTLLALPGAAVFLSYETRTLCARINQFLGHTAVVRLKFVQAASAPPPPLHRQKPPGPLDPADPVRRFSGPSGLAEALQALARRRSPSRHIEPQD